MRPGLRATVCMEECKCACLCAPGYVRHPMYAGLLAFAFGLAAFTGDEARGAMATALAVVLTLKVGPHPR